MAKPSAAPTGAPRAISHVGIAVRSIDTTLGFWQGAMGLPLEHVEEVKGQGVRVAFLPIGGSRLELLEPTTADSPVGRFIEKRGEGLHHLAFEVDSAQAALRSAKGRGIEAIDAAPRAGARGCMVAFLHPKSCHGVLVEFVEEPAAAPKGRRRA